MSQLTLVMEDTANIFEVNTFMELDKFYLKRSVLLS